MIGTSKQFLTLAQASELLPGNPHPATIRRWARKGLHGGRVRLELSPVGGRIFVTAEALERFSKELAKPAPPEPKRLTVAQQRKARREDHERCLQVLKAHRLA